MSRTLAQCCLQYWTKRMSLILVMAFVHEVNIPRSWVIQAIHDWSSVDDVDADVVGIVGATDTIRVMVDVSMFVLERCASPLLVVPLSEIGDIGPLVV